MRNIVQAKPELTDSVLNTVNKTLESDKNNEVSLNAAYETLGTIVMAKPELAQSAVDITLTNKDSAYKPLVYRACLKNNSDFFNGEFFKGKEISGEIRTSIYIAKLGKDITDEDFKYALDNVGRGSLATGKLYSRQKEALDILVDAFAKEQGIDIKDETAKKEIIEKNKEWLTPASFRAAAVFTEINGFKQYIKKIQNYNKQVQNDIKQETEPKKYSEKDYLSIKDATGFFPKRIDKENCKSLSQFIYANIIHQKGYDVHRDIRELQLIAENWDRYIDKCSSLSPDEYANLKQKRNKGKSANEEKEDATETYKLTPDECSNIRYGDVLSLCASLQYENRRCSNFAIEAAKWKVDQGTYPKCEDIYLAGLDVPETFDSTKSFESKDQYVGRFLPRDDPRTLFFGNYTDCCQHYGSAGKSCAISTVMHPFSQLFVIEKKGDIVAGSWAWENTEGTHRQVCFDNIEALGSTEVFQDAIKDIYTQAGKYLIQEKNCQKVTIGMGCNDATCFKYNPEAKLISLPTLYCDQNKVPYSDAKRTQVLLVENPEARPLTDDEKNQSYIRPLCHLDKLPIGVTSNDHSGLVIEDRTKGVVGYCLYNEKEKTVYDIAVLEDHQKTKASRDLIQTLVDVIKKEGGQWTIPENTEQWIKSKMDEIQIRNTQTPNQPSTGNPGGSNTIGPNRSISR